MSLTSSAMEVNVSENPTPNSLSFSFFSLASFLIYLRNTEVQQNSQTNTYLLEEEESGLSRRHQ